MKQQTQTCTEKKLGSFAMHVYYANFMTCRAFQWKRHIRPTFTED